MNKYVIILIGIFIGAVAGFLYWNQIGCTSGGCSITSVWYNSTAYGAFMGGVGSTFFIRSESDGNKEAEI